ncbi:MAG: hypothetical protein LBO78_01575, partial [Rickettsiales bacterium]|nr:hypothetical protein [Rickettsiales bacterium]
MAVRFDREKLPNYIFAGIIFVAAVLFIRYVAIAFWRFDFFKLSHLRGFMKYAFTGKIFLNGRYLSMLFVLPGLGMLACAAVAAAYERDLAKLSEYVK